MTTRLEAAVQELVAAIRGEVHVATAATPDRLLSVEEAAEALGVGRTLVYMLIGNGQLRSLKVGRRRLVPWSALVQMYEAM